MTLEEYRFKLINKVLAASSPDDVKRYIKTAIKCLHENKVHGYLVDRFAHKTISNLQTVQEETEHTDQTINIQIATWELYRLHPVGKPPLQA